jgi:carbon monoxide dehydrogenase subunit G
MKLEGSQTIAADRATVWTALNDPDVLMKCIPGCQSLEKVDDTHFTAVVKQKIGPVSATFNGAIELQNLNPPESYTIAGEGKGGAAGFAKGGADVSLVEVEGGTELSYSAEAKVGGKLAQLGARLIDGVAKKQADAFFSTFKSTVEGPAEPEAPAEEAPAAEPVAADAAPAEGEPAPEGEKKGFWKKYFG